MRLQGGRVCKLAALPHLDTVINTTSRHDGHSLTVVDGRHEERVRVLHDTDAFAVLCQVPHAYCLVVGATEEVTTGGMPHYSPYPVVVPILHTGGQLVCATKPRRAANAPAL